MSSNSSTPDTFSADLLKISIAHLLKGLGVERCPASIISVFMDVTIKYLHLLASKTYEYSENSGRCLAQSDDVLALMNEMDIDPKVLFEWFCSWTTQESAWLKRVEKERQKHHRNRGHTSVLGGSIAALQMNGGTSTAKGGAMTISGISAAESRLSGMGLPSHTQNGSLTHDGVPVTDVEKPGFPRLEPGPFPVDMTMVESVSEELGNRGTSMNVDTVDTRPLATYPSSGDASVPSLDIEMDLNPPPIVETEITSSERKDRILAFDQTELFGNGYQFDIPSIPSSRQDEKLRQSENNRFLSSEHDWKQLYSKTFHAINSTQIFAQTLITIQEMLKITSVRRGNCTALCSDSLYGSRRGILDDVFVHSLPLIPDIFLYSSSKASAAPPPAPTSWEDSISYVPEKPITITLPKPTATVSAPSNVVPIEPPPVVIKSLKLSMPTKVKPERAELEAPKPAPLIAPLSLVTPPEVESTPVKPTTTPSSSGISIKFKVTVPQPNVAVTQEKESSRPSTPVPEPKATPIRETNKTDTENDVTEQPAKKMKIKFSVPLPKEKASSSETPIASCSTSIQPAPAKDPSPPKLKLKFGFGKGFSKQK